MVMHNHSAIMEVVHNCRGCCGKGLLRLCGGEGSVAQVGWGLFQDPTLIVHNLERTSMSTKFLVEGIDQSLGICLECMSKPIFVD